MHTIEINQALDLIGAAMQSIEGEAWRKLAAARDILLAIADETDDE